MESMFVQIHSSVLFVGAEQILHWLLGILYLLISEECNISDEFPDLVLGLLTLFFMLLSFFLPSNWKKNPNFYASMKLKELGLV